MQSCFHCRHETPADENQCSRCGTDLQITRRVEGLPINEGARGGGVMGASPTTAYEPVARFTNIAEAGYFHSELEGRLDCEVHLKTQDHFDAPSASWWCDYLLTVPSTETENAVAVLTQLISETEDSGSHDFGIDSAPDRAVLPAIPSTPDSRISWTPIVLTLAAGTFVVWAFNQAHLRFRGPVNAGANGSNLWDTLGENDQPWVQRLDGGRRRELSIDPGRGIAVLRDDTDGDGILDRVTPLPQGR